VLYRKLLIEVAAIVNKGPLSSSSNKISKGKYIVKFIRWKTEKTFFSFSFSEGRKVFQDSTQCYENRALPPLSNRGSITSNTPQIVYMPDAVHDLKHAVFSNSPSPDTADLFTNKALFSSGRFNASHQSITPSW